MERGFAIDDVNPVHRPVFVAGASVFETNETGFRDTVCDRGAVTGAVTGSLADILRDTTGWCVRNGVIRQRPVDQSAGEPPVLIDSCIDVSTRIDSLDGDLGTNPRPVRSFGANTISASVAGSNRSRASTRSRRSLDRSSRICSGPASDLPTARSKIIILHVRFPRPKWFVRPLRSARRVDRTWPTCSRGDARERSACESRNSPRVAAYPGVTV